MTPTEEFKEKMAREGRHGVYTPGFDASGELKRKDYLIAFLGVVLLFMSILLAIS